MSVHLVHVHIAHAAEWSSARMVTHRNASRLTVSAPWWASEDAVRISDLPRIAPRLPDGRRVSLASCYRWTTAGLHGVRLRRFRSGGTWCTTAQELTRWQAALTAAAEVVSA